MKDRAAAQSDLAPAEVLISIRDQRMLVLREGGWLKKYKISTSRFGLGDNFGSYKTPLGKLRVWEKLGGALPSGAVLKGREATGEVLAANAPGRDPIVSRILWLEGLEPQNDNARGRGIYIHGTTEEVKLGKPVSWGCIRMRSEDVIELYDILQVGALVTIAESELPRFAKWKPGTSTLIASQTATSVAAPKSTRSIPELVSAVGELLKSSAQKMVRADAGAASAFQGSILFSGLQTANVTPPKPAKQSPKAPSASDVPLPGDALALVATPDTAGAFPLALISTTSPLALVDLRRVALSPLLATASILDAPPPAFTYTEEQRGNATMSAVQLPTHEIVR